MATQTLPSARRAIDHFFYMRCGPYGFFCDCDVDSSSRYEELNIEEASCRPCRPSKLKRRPSMSAVALSKSLSGKDASKSHGIWELKRGVSRLNVQEGTIDRMEGERDENDEGGSDLLAIDEVEEVQAFNAAASAGRFLSAAAELNRLEAAGLESHHLESLLEPVLVERVRRIDDKYHYSLSMFSKPVEDLPIHEIDVEQKLEWGIELRNGVMRSILRIEEPDLDIITAFAGMQERDMHKEFNKGLTDVISLGEPDSHDNFWRTFSYSSTTKMQNDNVAVISALDALDEKGSALWGAMYTLAETTAAVNGISIPPVEDGHHRSELFHAWKLSPLRRCRDATKGFHMSHFIEIKLPAASRYIVDMMPSFMIKGIARSRVLQFPMGFRKFVLESQMLSERLKDSPRSGFYRELRERMMVHAENNTSKEPVILPAV